MSVASVKAALDKLESYMEGKSSYGTCDSEPIRLKRRIIRLALKGGSPKAPSTAYGWEIYDIEGCEAVAQSLGMLMDDVVREIGQTTVADANSQEFKNLVAWYD